MINQKIKAGFTLIELIMVVAIIGTILTVSFISFTNARQKARDTKRLSDITQIQNTLELYLRDEGRYPDAITFGSSLTGSSSIRVYMNNLPQNPSPRDDGVCPNNDYIYTINESGYLLDFCLSEPTAQLTAGEKCATPQGILNRRCFTCGTDQIVISTIAGHPCGTGDTCTYDTIQIGDQCWLRQNLNIGNYVTGATTQTDNEILEKYCYNNDNNNCVTDGALYQWDEAMQYGSLLPGTQGVCPSGWHLPTDFEQHTLENFLSNPYLNICNPDRINVNDCGPAGSVLQNIDGFNFIISGLREINGSFNYRNTYSWMWSSSLNEPEIFVRAITSGGQSIGRNSAIRNYGMSVRCLKN